MLRYMQGFESCRNNADMLAQGFTNPYGASGNAMIPVPTNNVFNGEMFRLETFQNVAADRAPNFAGTTAQQVNTNLTIKSLWDAGGFVFGMRGAFRDTGTPYTIGDVTPLTVANHSADVANRIVWDGTKYWSMRVLNGASSGTICTSTDLITWTDTVSQPSSPPASISFQNNVVIVTFKTGLSYTTDNGATWTNSPVPALGDAVPVPLSNVVYANGKYYVCTSNLAMVTRTYTSTDLVTWTLFDTFQPLPIQDAGGAGSTLSSMLSTLFHDPVRQRIFHLINASADGDGGGNRNFARLRSFDYAGVVTINYTISALPRSGIASIATDGTATGAIVICSTTGQIIFSSGANPTSWTVAAQRPQTIHDSATQTVAYEPNTNKFVLTANAGVVMTSVDGVTWTTTNPTNSTNYNVGLTYINSQLVATGKCIVTNNGALGWSVKQWSENAQISSASTTSQGSSRLGFAAINAASRSSYVGLYGTTAINAATQTAQFGFSSNNVTTGADVPAETYNVSTVNGYPYFEFLCTATAVVNQFSVQVMINGVVVSASPFIVTVAATTDTTSTLYLTWPMRNQGVSVLPTLIGFDDIYVLDFSGTSNNAPLRDPHILAYRPTSDVQAQWTKNPGSAVSNAAAASGSAASTSASSVSAVSPELDIYNVGASFDLSNFAVKAVSVESTFTNTSIGGNTVKLGITSGGVSVDSGSINTNIGNSTFVSKLQETDPNTGLPWTKTAALATKITVQKVN